MSNHEAPKPKTVGTEPESRLDRIARDLSRNLLHGARVPETSGRIRPSTVVTGQEIAVNLPGDSSDMPFSFAGKGAANVKIPFAQAAAADKYMADAVTNPRYLTLQEDSTIPTWSVQQRQFSFGDLTAPESRVDISAPAAAALIALPGGAVEEVDTAASPMPDQPGGGSFVTLWRLDAQSGTGNPLPRTNWRPAIMVRFPLTNSTVPGLPDHPDPTARLFVLKGTPQGDRYFLDQLGLLEGNPNVGVTGLAFVLEQAGQNTAPTRRAISDWTIARTNLSLEARPGDTRKFAAALAAPPSLPFIALSSDASPLDAIRLLQMNSITNSGGYSLRAKTDLDADTLICLVLLDAQADPNPDHLESTLLPPSANAVAVPADAIPQTVRFNGHGHTEIAPFVPPGFVSFGWTRSEPSTLDNDPDRFGFGTISMVEFFANDGTGQPITHSDFAISPALPLRGDSFDKFQPSGKAAPAATAAMRILASHQLNPVNARAAATDSTRTQFFRSSLRCFVKAPWERLDDKGTRRITLTPAFRDVFGNRFDATTAPAVTRSLFYTDALISPAEWPGVKVGLYASANGLTLEMSYDKQQATDERANRLEQIATQLDGKHIMTL